MQKQQQQFISFKKLVIKITKNNKNKKHQNITWYFL